MRKLAQRRTAGSARSRSSGRTSPPSRRGSAERRQIVVGEIEALEAQRARAAGEARRGRSRTIAEQQAQLEAKRDGSRRSSASRSRTISENLGAAKEHRSGLLSRQKLLNDLEAQREGVSEGVKSSCASASRSSRSSAGWWPTCCASMSNTPTSIEAALDGRDQWLVTDDSAAALAAREMRWKTSKAA